MINLLLLGGGLLVLAERDQDLGTVLATALVGVAVSNIVRNDISKLEKVN